MARYVVLALPTLFLLAACGGGSTGGGTGGGGQQPGGNTGPTDFNGLTRSLGTPFTIPADPEAADQTLTFTDADGDPQTIALSESPLTAVKQFDRIVDNSQTLYGFRRDEAGVSVAVFAITDDADANLAPGARVDSRGGTFPDTGSATFNGGYVGFLSRDGDAGSPFFTESRITGDVEITADFANGSVSGFIDRRRRFLTSDNSSVGTLSSVALNAHAIADGVSVGNGGTTAGGGIDDLPTYVPENGPQTGSWSVAFGNENAVEAGGIVRIIHDYDNAVSPADDFIETGGFLVTTDAD